MAGKQRVMRLGDGYTVHLHAMINEATQKKLEKLAKARSWSLGGAVRHILEDWLIAGQKEEK